MNTTLHAFLDSIAWLRSTGFRKFCTQGIVLGLLAGPIIAADPAPYYFSTYAGVARVGSADGIGESARFNMPVSLALDAQSNLYVTDSGNKSVRKITPAGVVTTVAGRAGDARSVDGPVAQARFTAVDCVAVDTFGAIYVANRTALRRISPNGEVTTLAGDPSSMPWGVRESTELEMPPASRICHGW